MHMKLCWPLGIEEERQQIYALGIRENKADEWKRGFMEEWSARTVGLDVLITSAHWLGLFTQSADTFWQQEALRTRALIGNAFRKQTHCLNWHFMKGEKTERSVLARDRENCVYLPSGYQASSVYLVCLDITTVDPGYHRISDGNSLLWVNCVRNEIFQLLITSPYDETLMNRLPGKMAVWGWIQKQSGTRIFDWRCYLCLTASMSH